MPLPQLPPFSYVRADNTTADFLDMVSELGSGLLVLPLIILLEDIAICKAFSDGKTIDATQEMIALGVANIANSFMQAYPGGGSLARSVVSNGSGVKTTFNGLYTGKCPPPAPHRAAHHTLSYPAFILPWCNAFRYYGDTGVAVLHAVFRVYPESRSGRGHHLCHSIHG